MNIGREWVGTHLPDFWRAASALVIGLGCAVALEWLTAGYPWTKTWLNLPAMPPATAVGFVLLGSCLWRLGVSNQSGQPDRFGTILAGFVTVLGATELASSCLGLKFQLDHVLLPKGILASRDAQAMAPNTALDFLCCGGGSLLVNRRTGSPMRPAHCLVVLAGLIALLGLIGYTYQVLLVNRLGGGQSMTFGTALGFLWFCAGFLAARPDNSIMGLLLSRTTGGEMVRRLLPMAIVIPWLLGAVLLMGELAGYYEREAAVSIFAVANIVIFSGLIWWHAQLLHLTELERGRAERRLAAQHSATRVVAESRTLDEAIPRILQATCRALGWQVGGFWVVDPEVGLLRCTRMIPANPTVNLLEFADASAGMTLTRGVGLPGRVWESGNPAWVVDVTADSPRADLARKAGLHAAFAFPIALGQERYRVVEFLGYAPRPQDDQLLLMMGTVGSQIGQLIERQRAEQQLRQATANLQRSNADLQQFAYVASHDLFEPLRMVVGYLQLLRERYARKLDEQAQEFIRFAVDGGFRMQALINDLLTYSRLDSQGRVFEVVDCEQVFEAAIANLKVALEETKATVEHGPLPQVRADPVQLTQVFQNLLGNALKFHGTAAPRIDVNAHRRDGEWLFTIQDNGIGIEPQHFERIFVIFQRLHTRQEYPGTGIGLAICKKIIERHGGRIWVQSAADQGSIFFFTLPA